MNKTIIETNNLTKTYGNTIGVENINLRILHGEIVGFVGPNGAGKTTSIKLLLKIIHPSNGHGSIFGHDIRRYSIKIRLRTGYMPGEPNLYEHLNGRQFLKYILDFYHLPDFERAHSLAKHFKLPLDKKIRNYSSGMKQILLFIQAVCHNADLLLLDEPTKGMDPTVRQEILNLILQENSAGRTILLSSHVLPEIEKVCQRVIYIRKGRLIDPLEIHKLEKNLLSLAEITFDRDVDEDPFKLPNIKIVRRENRTIFISVQGDPAPLLKKLAELPVAKLNFRRAQLEDLYRGLFKDD